MPPPPPPTLHILHPPPSLTPAFCTSYCVSFLYFITCLIVKSGVVRARQVRLDYNTSEHLLNVASEFNATKFAEAFKAAHVNSVTVTARCHHGFLYYQSTQHKSLVHPNLNSKCMPFPSSLTLLMIYSIGNLLVEQVKALHRAGIRAPVQISVGWDQHSAVHHPEWLQIPSQPRQHSTVPSFYSLCLNTSYRNLVRSIVEEIITTLEAARYEGILLSFPTSSPFVAFSSLFYLFSCSTSFSPNHLFLL